MMNTPANDTTTIDPSAPLTLGETRQINQWRLHLGAVSCTATDTTNAGKRGRKCHRVSVYTLAAYNELSTAAVAVMTAAARLGVTVEAMRDLVTAAAAEAESIDFVEYRGVDVAPATFAPLKITTPRFYAEFRFDGFSVRDTVDQNNEPTLVNRGGTESHKRAYAWAQAHAAELQSMTFGQVEQALVDAGVNVHSYCAVD